MTDAYRDILKRFRSDALSVATLAFVLLLSACGHKKVELLEQAKADYKSGDFEAADSVIRKIARQGLMNGPTAVLLVKTDLALSEGDAAAKALGDAKKYGISIETLQPIEAETEMKLGNSRHANTLADQLLNTSPAVTHHIRGLTYAQNEDFRLAEQELSQAHMLEPTNSLMALDDAYAKSRLGLFDQAIAEAAKIRALQPKNMQAILFIATTMVQKGDHRGALAAYDAALSIHGDSVPTLMGKAEAERNLGMNKAALETLDKVDKLSSINPSSKLLRGKIYGELGRFELALQFFTSSGMDIGEDAEASDISGKAYMHQNLAWTAITNFEAAVRQRPDIVQYHFDLINALIQAGDVIAAGNALDSLPLEALHSAQAEKLRQKLKI